MKVFDMNVHLAYAESLFHEKGTQTERAAKNLLSENSMLIADYQACLEGYSALFQENISAANFMFFNPSLFYEASFEELFKKIGASYQNSVFTALIDFRGDNQEVVLERLASVGFRGIKFHPYAQEITSEDWERIVKITERAEKLNLAIFVCTSFGTSKMHKHNGISLACSISERVSNAPIILLHSGGARLYEAMLLADDKPNIYLDTSFTLNYFNGSKLFEEFAFIYRKIGPKRVLYGSDFPYMPLEESKSVALSLFERNGFSSKEIESVFYNNALEIFFS
ncbi:amidohydrolase family protein [Leptospira santarosai str. CBC523]|uniref:amidohydrolase family protein n=1 Tax=Leptospira santarosai TaxID=28183 RepID=UPI0002BD7449|nr:amidohydrolase family protein [Leptospira santarosai]EMO15714.1 amidohydrolase family protein [Leptospira santarosai str. CBC523]